MKLRLKNVEIVVKASSSKGANEPGVRISADGLTVLAVFSERKKTISQRDTSE